MLCKVVANNHSLTYFFCWSLMLSQMEIFRNSIRNASYSASNFIEWFIVKDLDIRNVKCCCSHFFFIKTNKMIFPEVTMTIISENRSTKCLQCIKYDNSWRKSLMWKNAVLYLFSPKIGAFVKVIHRSSH